MDYLRGGGPEGDAVRPDLVILDLGLPKKDGREVLAEMGADPALKDIPVIILTVTRAERPLIQELGIHPSRYCSKPLELLRFKGIMRDILG
jgi:DNA-binding response OmpR family regulator